VETRQNAQKRRKNGAHPIGQRKSRNLPFKNKELQFLSEADRRWQAEIYSLIRRVSGKYPQIFPQLGRLRNSSTKAPFNGAFALRIERLFLSG
jgi:hypothetical protein